MFPIRAVEDDHVDRTGVDVQQCMKLTVTNSSIGLIVLIDHAHLAAKAADDAITCSNHSSSEPASHHIALKRPGGHGGAAAPVPIPNTAVKRPSANGTSSQDAGE